jgi:uncharacterized protein (TIGR03083 family)
MAATEGHLLEFTSGGARVVLDFLPVEALGALMRLRTRLMRTIDTLPLDAAEQPSRCADWRVVDVVNHLADATTWAAQVTAAAAEGRPSAVFAGFHVRATPRQLTEAAPRDLDAARARLHEAMAASLGQVAEVVAARDRPTETPLGPQPFPVAALHVLWDTWLHERDICIPLGIDAPEHEDETRLAAIYSLRLLGLCVAMAGREASAALRLHGATGITLQFDASASLTSVRIDPTATAQLSGDAATVVDAITGRGDLDAALHGPAEQRASLAALRPLLAGR